MIIHHIRLYINHLRRQKKPTNRWLAAAVWIGREYLTEPKSLAGRPLAQNELADRFRLTRRQLTYALKKVRDPQFTDQVWSIIHPKRK